MAATTGRCEQRSSKWWADAMRGQDFRTEDHLDTTAFNAALWRGLGSGSEPVERKGEDLRFKREDRLKEADGLHCLGMEG